FDEQGLSLEEPLIQVLQDTGFTDPSRIFIQSFEIANLLDLQGQLNEVGLGDTPLVQLFGDTAGDFINEGGGGFSVPFDVVANGDLSEAELEAIYGGLANFIDFENPTYGDLTSQDAIAAISEYAAGLGPWKNNILLRESLDEPVDGNGDGEAEITTQLTGEVFPLIDRAHEAGLQVHPYTLRNEERFLTLTADGTPQTPEEEFEQLIDIGADGFFTDFPRTGDPVRDKLVAEEVRSPNNPDFNFDTLNGQTPLVIAHRGASGDLPEHTLEAYRLAIYQGADFVEPDLVITSDGVLIARHEPTLAQVELTESGEIALDVGGNPIVLQNSTLTTNVAELEQFTGKLTVKSLDGALVGGWFAEDFTLEEIKQVRARQPRDFRSQAFNGEFEIPTFQEVIELVQEVSPLVGRDIGIYPETKHPTFFDEQGLSLEEPLVQTLIETGFTDPDRIFIQSFEVQNLIELREDILPNAGAKTVTGIDFIGAASFETGTLFEGTEVGGISGLTFDAGNSLYYGLSDDRGNRAEPVEGAEADEPSRYYDITIDLSDGALDEGDVAFTEVTTLLNASGNPFLAGSLDPEGIVLTDGTLFISSEGSANDLIPPFVNEFTLDGQVIDTLPLPEKFFPTADQSSGIQNNQAFESLTIAPDQKTLFTATESALFQDGEVASLDSGSPSRILEYNLLTGEPAAEYVYLTDPIPVAPAPADGFADNGLVELLTLDDAGTLLALERSFASGVGNDIRLYEVSLDGATDVSEFDTLDGLELDEVALDKRLIANFGEDFGIDVDNDEAVAFGPTLADGSQSLIIASDNNFNDAQETQFLGFSLDIESADGTPDLSNLPLVQLFGDVEDQFINEGGGGFSVPFDFVANADQPEAELEAIYGELTDLVDFSDSPTYADLANPEVATAISGYADGIGPWKNSILLRESLDEPVDGNGDGEAEITTQLTGEVFPLIDFAHDAGLQVHPYTLRNEERFLTLTAEGEPQTPGQEFEQLIDIGADGFFTDFPATGRTVVEQFETAEEFANLSGSRGYEGMAFSPDRQTLYPLLEGAVFGDPEGSLRIYEFDVASSAFEGILGLYQLDEANHAIGDFTPINADEFLVIERDGGQGESAEFKKIFKVNLSEISDGFVEKTEVVDLLDIADPNDLNGDGETTFDFPFVTIEDVLVLDEDTILVANDNNYPFSVGRGPDIDNNEIIQLQLSEPLALDPSLGVAGLTGAEGLDFEGDVAAGTVITDQLSGVTVSTSGPEAMIFDTANPTGGDTDLASDSLGNVLILSEDGDATNPDDSDSGGTFEFTWDELVNVASVGLLDIEEAGGSITAFGDDSAVLGSIDTTSLTANGAFGTAEVGIDGVRRLDVTLTGSGAIAEVNFA
ncbi:MAG: esterase-like activity of phytase family protein, partial [Elainellaceae cyanobacterium]